MTVALKDCCTKGLLHWRGVLISGQTRCIPSFEFFIAVWTLLGGGNVFNFFTLSVYQSTKKIWYFHNQGIPWKQIYMFFIQTSLLSHCSALCTRFLLLQFQLQVKVIQNPQWFHSQTSTLIRLCCIRKICWPWEIPAWDVLVTITSLTERISLGTWQTRQDQECESTSAVACGGG